MTITATNLLPASASFPANWNGTAPQRLEEWLQKAQEIVNRNYATNFPNLIPSVLEMSDGRRYVRIDVISNGGSGQRSVWAFIDKFTGDVLKAATYKTPAKHARGNLFDSDGGVGKLTPYGPAYLKG